MTVAEATGADFVLGGRVLRYEDYEGPAGRTRVEFSTVLIEKKSGKVVWSSASDERQRGERRCARLRARDLEDGSCHGHPDGQADGRRNRRR